MPFVVGLTGGIGSGKSTVADLFARLGAEVVDTDAIARELTCAGQPVLQTIAEAFGAQMLTPNGELDRAKLRERVFGDPEERRKLEALMHPNIRRVANQRVEHSTKPYVILVVPLLVETGGYAGLISRVLVVDCPEELQIERVMQRSGLTRSEVEAIVQAQATRSQRLAQADDVVVNDRGPEALGPAIRDLHAKYLELGAQAR